MILWDRNKLGPESEGTESTGLQALGAGCSPAAVERHGVRRAQATALSHSFADKSRRDGFRLASVALLVWSALYALPHLYWGLGGTSGFSVLKPSASKIEGWEAANLVAFVLIAGTGFVGFGLEAARQRPRLRLILWTIAGTGCAIAGAHGAYGIVFRASAVAGLRDIDGEPFDTDAHGWVLWDLLAIEPWFLAEGILLGLVGCLALRTGTGRTRWLGLVGAGFLIAFASGALGLKVG
jgi:hypothetical protein